MVVGSLAVLRQPSHRRGATRRGILLVVSDGAPVRLCSKSLGLLVTDPIVVLLAKVLEPTPTLLFASLQAANQPGEHKEGEGYT